jgi:signal transduction histidine kinase
MVATERRISGEQAVARDELTRVLTVLFAARWAAWAIAAVRIISSGLPPDQTAHEPLLLGFTFGQSLLTTLYVPVLRPGVQRFSRTKGRDDLIFLGLADIAAVVVTVYLAGGFRNPYEEYIYASLTVPAFLLDRKGSLLLLTGFLAALFGAFALRAGTLDGEWFQADVSRLASIIAVSALVVAVLQYLSGLTRRLQEQREEASRALAENVRLQKEREEFAALEERARIAREIHDGIAQSIYMLTLNLDKAADLAEDRSDLAQRLHGLVSLAKEALLEVRYYIFDLKPLLSGQATLRATIEGQAREFSAVSGLPVRFSVEGREDAAPIAVSTCLYRVAQEALANVYRHARASSIDVRLGFEGGVYALEVRDDGCGFSPSSAGSGRGLQSIEQRVAELGGAVEVATAPDHGTVVTVTVPGGGKP